MSVGDMIISAFVALFVAFIGLAVYGEGRISIREDLQACLKHASPEACLKIHGIMP